MTPIQPDQPSDVEPLGTKGEEDTGPDEESGNESGKEGKEEEDGEQPDAETTAAWIADIRRRNNEAVRELLHEYGETIMGNRQIELKSPPEFSTYMSRLGSKEWMEDLVHQAEIAQERVEKLTTDLAAQTNGTAKDVEVTGRDRAVEEVRRNYWPRLIRWEHDRGRRGLPAFINGKVVYEKVDAIYQALAAIDRLQTGRDVLIMRDVEIVGVKDSFLEPQPGGWRGVDLIIDLGGESGYAVVRLALNTIEAYMETNGRKARETVDAMVAAAESTPDKSFTPEQAEAIGQLKQTNEIEIARLFIADREQNQKAPS